MNHEELSTILQPSKGKLTVTHDTLTSNIGDFLTTFNWGEPYVINNAEVISADGENNAIIISGTSSYLNVKNLPVTAHFDLDEDGNTRILLKYRLREDGVPPANAWTFTRCFPSLPAVVDYSTPVPAGLKSMSSIYDAQKPYLDSLYLYDSHFAVSTHDRVDPDFDTALEKGVNFISRMRPMGMLGILEYALGDGEDLTLSGPVRIPREKDRTQELQLLERVWDRPDSPGIHLTAPLGLEYKLGGMIFHQAVFRAYTPVSNDWYKQNPSFEPVHGYAGRLSIPGADIEIDLVGDLEWGMPEVQLYANLEGVSIGKLAQLADLAGTDNLVGQMPAELQKAVDALSKLELQHILLDLSLSDNVPALNSVVVTVGMPDLNWKLFDGLFELKEISARFEIREPFGKISGGYQRLIPRTSSFSVIITGSMDIGGVPVTVSAISDNGFALYAKLDAEQTIPLKQLMKKYLPGLPAPTDLTVNGMAVTIAPGDFYAMSAMLAGEPNPWSIPIGKGGLTVSDVSMMVQYSQQEKNLSGYFAGAVGFAGVKLYINYGFPGDFVVRGDFPEMQLSKLLSVLTNQKVSLPGNFDLDFEYSSVIIKKQQNDFVFQFATHMKNVGAFVFETRKTDGKWGFALGLDLSVGKLSTLPGLDALKVFEDAFNLQKLLIAVSSFDDSNFTFPDMAQFNNPALSTGSLTLPSTAGGATAGFYIYGRWHIDTKKNEQKLLKNLLGLEADLGVALFIGKDPSKNSKLFVNFETKIQGHPFICNFGAMISNGEPAFFLTGHMTLQLQGKQQVFDLTLLFVKSGAFLSGSMKGTIEFNSVKLSNLALVIGVNWGGVPSLGIAATINVKKFNSSIAIFFDSTNPAKSLLAGSVSSLTLADVASTLAGTKNFPAGMKKVLEGIQLKGTDPFQIPANTADAFDNQDIKTVAAAFKKKKIGISTQQDQILLHVKSKGSSWSLTDMKNNMRHYEIEKTDKGLRVALESQVYLAPQRTQLGALVFEQGFFLSCTLGIYGLEATARVEIKEGKGIAAQVYLNKSVVILNDKFFKLSDASGRKGPRLSFSTFNQPEMKEEEFRLPHFYLSGKLRLLGLVNTCYIKATTKGLELFIQTSLSARINQSGVSASANISYTITGSFSSDYLAAGIAFTVKLQGKVDPAQVPGLKKNTPASQLMSLGKVSVNINARCGASVSYDQKKGIASLWIEFTFLGEKIKANPKIQVNKEDLAHVEQLIAKEIENAAEKVLKNAEKWVNAVKDGFIDGVKDASKVANGLKNAFDKSGKDAVKLLEKSGAGVNEIGGALKGVYKMSSDDAIDVLKKANKTPEEVAGVLKNAYKMSSKDVANALKGPFNLGKEGVEKALKGAGYAAKEVEKGLKSFGKDVENFIKGILG